MAKEKDRKGAETEIDDLPAKFGGYASAFMREKGVELMRGDLKPTGVKPMDIFIQALAFNDLEAKRRLDRIERELGL